MAVNTVRARLPCVAWKTCKEVYNKEKIYKFIFFDEIWCLKSMWSNRNYSNEVTWSVQLFSSEPNSFFQNFLKYCPFFILSCLESSDGKILSVSSSTWRRGNRSNVGLFDIKESELADSYRVDVNNITVYFMFQFNDRKLEEVIGKLHEGPKNANMQQYLKGSSTPPDGTQPEQTSCSQIFSEDIEKLFDNTEFSDALLKCSDRSFSVNRNILSVRSDVFAAMFRNKMSENETGIVEITDIHSSVLEQLLRYIYTGRWKPLCMDSVFDLYKASDKYALLPLKRKCASFMVENLSEENVCSVLLLANTFEDSLLMENVMPFLTKRKQFMKTEVWREFARKHPAVAVEIYVNAE